MTCLRLGFFHGRLHKQEMGSMKKAVVIGMCMFGVVCLVGIASINILELSGVIDV